MKNPKHIENKYAEIPYGYFQGIVNAVSSEEIADGQDKVFSKLMKPKSRIEVALTEDITDDQGREIKVYYLTDSLPFFNQDGEMDSYILEQVTYKGRRVHYSSKGEQAILEYLNRLNPAGLKYSVRA